MKYCNRACFILIEVYSCSFQRKDKGRGFWRIVIIFIVIIIIISRHVLGPDRPASVSSNSLFKGLPSRLRTERKIFGRRRNRENFIMKSFSVCAHHQILFVIKLRRIILAEHVTRMGNEEMNTVFWLRDLKKGDHLDDPAIDGNTALKWILRNSVGRHGLE
jgi:hypothetical protein